jgi:ParB/RepB/Spo0J family partition protein
MTPDTIAVQTRLPIALILRSPTNPRKRFPEAEHLELTASIAKHDVLQPVLVRPWPGRAAGEEAYELVAGERRHRAAEAAGKADIPALVRDLSDDEVLHIQIIENLQRKDVHPLEEADGFKLLQDRGHTIEQISEEVSQSRTYVTQRLKLASLIEPCRQLFFDGKLTSSTALLIARLPAELQQKAADEITDEDRFGWGEPMSVREASEHIQETYMLRLDHAPFKTDDAELVPSAGACGPCPKRTGNQTELFGDVQSAETCTDPSCFQQKRAAAAAQKVAAAEASGRTVITGQEAKSVKPKDYSPLKGGWIDLDDRCRDDPKQRTFREIIGVKAAKAAAVLDDPHNGKLRDVMKEDDVKKLLADKGIEAPRPQASQESREVEKKRAEDAYRAALFEQVREIHRTHGLDEFDLKIVATSFYRRLWNENQKRICKLYGWDSKTAISEADFAKRVDEIAAGGTPGALALLVMEIALVDELVSATYSTAKPNFLEAIARGRGLDPAQIRKAVDAERKAAAKPKAKPKAPAAKKSTPRPIKRVPVTEVLGEEDDE